MESNFNRSLDIILKHEGGYVNHPADPGGMTNLGVTKKNWDTYIGRVSTLQEFKALKKEDVAPFYKKKYWDLMFCNDLPSGVDLCVFDFGLNAGPSRGTKYLQKALGIKEDGDIGPGTHKAMDSYIEDHGVEALVRRYQDLRAQYYKGLKTFPTFGKGWLRRVQETTESALKII